MVCKAKLQAIMDAQGQNASIEFHKSCYCSYTSRNLLPAAAKVDLVAGEQIGEQTAINTGKGGLKGMPLSPDLVTEWIGSFPIAVYLSDAMENWYCEESHDTCGYETQGGG